MYLANKVINKLTFHYLSVYFGDFSNMIFKMSCSISFRCSLYFWTVNLTASVKPPPGMALILVKLNKMTPELRPTPQEGRKF